MSKDTETYNTINEKLETLTKRIEKIEGKKKEIPSNPNWLAEVARDYDTPSLSDILIPFLIWFLLDTLCFILDEYYGYHRSVDVVLIVISVLGLCVFIVLLIVGGIIEIYQYMLGKGNE